MNAQTNPILYNDFPAVIDNTAREQFVTCPTKFLRSTVQKLALKETSHHLHFGGAFALGLETLRRAFYEQQLPEPVALRNAVVAATKYYGNFETAEGEVKNYTALVHGLYAYVERYPLKTDMIQPIELSKGKRAIEFTFAIPIPEVVHPQTGDPLLYAGRFDMIGNFQGTRFGLDDKTTGQLGPKWAQQWNLASQLTGYCWAARESELPLAGFVIRGQSILKTGFGFAEPIIYRPSWQIDRWLDQLIHDTKRMIEAWKQQRYDMALGGACSHYGGCPYSRLCESPDPARWIETEYRNNFWNPLAKDPEETYKHLTEQEL